MLLIGDGLGMDRNGVLELQIDYFYVFFSLGFREQIDVEWRYLEQKVWFGIWVYGIDFY